MPSYVVPATGEVETCFAAYYDFSGQVPTEFLSEDGTKLRYAAQEMRQDALSHHLVLDVSGVELDQIHHPSFGEWTCKGGARAGEACEPTDLASCPGGVCGATPVHTSGCVGYGPDSHFLTMGTPPYETRNICAEYTLPQGARLIELTSHTHKRGKHFFADAPDGSRIYESFRYSDPLYQPFDPPLAFDDPGPATRTLRYCSLFNNGVAADGSPDPGTVTRASRMPDRTSCKPVACTAGRVGAACAGTNDDAACDSAPGSGDCDACAITAGATTENEMFLLLGWFYRER